MGLTKEQILAYIKSGTKPIHKEVSRLYERSTDKNKKDFLDGMERKNFQSTVELENYLLGH